MKKTPTITQNLGLYLAHRLRFEAAIRRKRRSSFLRSFLLATRRLLTKKK
jgi:hypothetical protein